MKKVQHFFICAVSVFFFSSSFAQSVTPAVLNATGGTNFFTFYRFEWSFGEAMVIETQTSPNLIVTQGVLQPETQTRLLTVPPVLGIKMKLKFYLTPLKMF